MITDDEKQHYLAVKKLSALLKGITSNHTGYFYSLNGFHSYSTKEKLKSIKMCVRIILLVCTLRSRIIVHVRLFIFGKISLLYFPY